MLFDHRRDPADTRYNVTRLYRLPPDIDLDRLDAAIRDVAMLHGPLHVSFSADRHDLGRDAAVSFDRVGDATVDEFRALADRERAVPFDLDAGPLVRVHAAATVEASGLSVTSVLIGMHHISVDAGAFDVFWDQVATAYAGRPLVEPTVSYAAHADWQRREVHPMHAEFWATERADADARPSPGRLGLAGPVPPEADGYLSKPLDVTASELRRGPGRTPFVASLAAASATIARYAGDPHVEIGITASVKDHPAAAPLVGYHLNTLPIRVDAFADSTFAELCSQVGDVVADAVEHRTYPFASIVRDARAAGVRPPDVSIMLAYERLAPAQLDGVVVSHEILASGTAVADVTLFVQERGEDLAVGIEYSGAIVSAADAERMLDSFAQLLDGVVSAPEVSVGALFPSDDAGRDLVGPDLPRSGASVLHDIVDWCERTPDAVAGRRCCGSLVDLPRAPRAGAGHRRRLGRSGAAGRRVRRTLGRHGGGDPRSAVGRRGVRAARSRIARGPPRVDPRLGRVLRCPDRRRQPRSFLVTRSDRDRLVVRAAGCGRGRTRPTPPSCAARRCLCDLHVGIHRASSRCGGDARKPRGEHRSSTGHLRRATEPVPAHVEHRFRQFDRGVVLAAGLGWDDRAPE